ncbi:hypothetical protein PS662_05219 [Pseudomonas fluorescens]|uniref:RND transporter n=1 Tax=Pseudomonas fluorescens TaxID=294 RepID=A0A5E6X6Y3_PSEFL|nr:hypothetical protein PS662_05219 [Pseudomonas fluorescens]
MKAPLSLLTLCVLLSACASPDPRPDSGLQPPPDWQSAHSANNLMRNAQWWTRFGSPQLDQLIAQARIGSYDLAAALARVRKAQATTVIAGGSRLPEVRGAVNANRQKLMRGNGYS